MTRLRSLSRHSCSDSSPSSFLYCTPNSVAVDIPATELFGSDGDGGGDGNGSSAGSKKDALGYTVAWLPYQHGQAVDILAASAVTTGEAPASSALSSSGDTSSAAAAAAAAAASTPGEEEQAVVVINAETPPGVSSKEKNNAEETATERSSTEGQGDATTTPDGSTTDKPASVPTAPSTPTVLQKWVAARVSQQGSSLIRVGSKFGQRVLKKHRWGSTPMGGLDATFFL